MSWVKEIKIEEALERAGKSKNGWVLKNDEKNATHVGSTDWEWVLFMACDIMSGSESRQMLHQGGHSIFGFNQTSWDGFDNAITEDFHIRAIQWSQTIELAFVLACVYNDGKWAAGATSFMHEKNKDDHIWGQGRTYGDPDSNDDIIRYDYGSWYS